MVWVFQKPILVKIKRIPNVVVGGYICYVTFCEMLGIEDKLLENNVI